MRYVITDTFEIDADNPLLNKKFQKIVLPERAMVNIIDKTKDMFDNNIEYWRKSDGWIFKITKENIVNFNIYDDPE